VRVRERWEGDSRGHGVADAGHLARGASELVAALRQDGWVAEQPDLHLLPHIAAWCERDDRLVLVRAHEDERGAYIVEVQWRDAVGSRGEVRAAVFALIGQFAESATYVRQRRLVRDERPAGLRFEIGTGELAPESRFAPHGHAVVIDVAGDF
jgi:hypothetical protein